MEQAAAIAVFAYKRAEHLRRMLRSLALNAQLSQSPISIYCDGARGAHEAQAVEEARAVARELAPAHARIVERERNLGLAASVIAGVSETIDAHGSAIVLEDDLELSPFALDYFNAALARYREEERVMHVAGFMYPVRAALPESFFYREATCFGWATWARAWKRFEPDGSRIRAAVLARDARAQFNAGAMDFLAMLEMQIGGRIDSWAIRWYGSLWLHGGLALHPGRSLVRNTGFDGSGVHSGTSSTWEVELGSAPVTRFPERIAEEPAAARAMTTWRKWQGRRERLHALRDWFSRLAG